MSSYRKFAARLAVIRTQTKNKKAGFAPFSNASISRLEKVQIPLYEAYLSEVASSFWEHRLKSLHPQFAVQAFEPVLP